MVFRVADTGIGIALSDQDRIFEEFTQIEGSHQQGKRGTGLGLPLSRKLAELLGGMLTVESQLGTGSRFTLSLPTVYGGPSEGALVREAPLGLDPERAPVLIIEDNREAQFIYEKFMQGSLFQPVAVQTISEARVMLQAVEPAAVILDVLLEHENTWSFLAELKTGEVTRRIPVIVVTLVDNEPKALSLGANAYHAKPVQREWLLEHLNRLVDPRSAQKKRTLDGKRQSRNSAPQSVAREANG
jgi:CheY-like chemotaxis protein